MFSSGARGCLAPPASVVNHNYRLVFRSSLLSYWATCLEEKKHVHQSDSEPASFGVWIYEGWKGKTSGNQTEYCFDLPPTASSLCQIRALNVLQSLNSVCNSWWAQRTKNWSLCRQELWQKFDHWNSRGLGSSPRVLVYYSERSIQWLPNCFGRDFTHVIDLLLDRMLRRIPKRW